jgi:hypothetical protein
MNEISTEDKLESALTRLLEGKPQRTKSDGKVNMLRINNEAGLSKGGINYYGEFKKRAEVRIALHKKNQIHEQIAEEMSHEETKIEKLKHERNTEKRLKLKYKEDRDNQKILTDEVIKENASLVNRLYELEAENVRFREGNIVPFP